MCNGSSLNSEKNEEKYKIISGPQRRLDITESIEMDIKDEIRYKKVKGHLLPKMAL